MVKSRKNSLQQILPWNFEAFRRFLNYECLQQAAASLNLFAGKQLFSDPAMMEEFYEILKTRTGMEWVPQRAVGEGVIFNVEGDLFRNKARVFTSFYLINPNCLESQKELIVTDFGKALGLGYISRKDFYKEIIKRFEYPHPAYEDNWIEWTKVGKSLKPLSYLLDILIQIYKIDGIGEVSIEELAHFAFHNAKNDSAKKSADSIIKSRTKRFVHERSDAIDRKIGDILGFLCIAGATYYKGTKIRLNLMARHKEERSLFWEKRDSENRLLEFEELIRLSRSA